MWGQEDGSDPVAEGRARAPCSVETLVSCSSGLENKIPSASAEKKKKKREREEKKKRKREIKTCTDFQWKMFLQKMGKWVENISKKNKKNPTKPKKKPKIYSVLETFLLCLRRMCTLVLLLHAPGCLVRLYPSGAPFASTVSTGRQQGDPGCRLYRGCHLTLKPY